MSKKLTHEFIATRVKNDRIENIKSINFWGNDIEEVSILRQMQNLEVISLSVNKIKSLRDFGYLKNLRELYLRKNLISDINEIKFLANCSNLRVLWINENPIALNKNYRLFVISCLPQLTKLDDNVITQEEKMQANNFNLQSNNNKSNDNESEGSEDNREATEDDFPQHDDEDNIFEVNNFEKNNNIRSSQNAYAREIEKNLVNKAEKDGRNDYAKPNNNNNKQNVNVSSSIDFQKKNARENRDINEGNLYENNNNNNRNANSKNLNNFGKKRGSIDNDGNNAKERNWDYLDNNEVQRQRENSTKYDNKQQIQSNLKNLNNNNNTNHKNQSNQNIYNLNYESDDNYYNYNNNNNNIYNNKIEKPDRLEKYDYSQNYPNYKVNSQYEDDYNENYAAQRLDDLNIKDQRIENNKNIKAPINRLATKKSSIDQNLINNNENFGEITKYDNQKKLAKMNKEQQSQNFSNINRSNIQTPSQLNKINNFNNNQQNIQQNYSNPNIVNSIFLLLKELNENDLLSIKNEVEKKLNDY